MLIMKTLTKKIAGISTVAAIAFGAIALSCKANNGSASVAYAQSSPAVNLPKESLEVTQALQNTFRSISSQVLPAVVEVDVTTKQTVQTFNPFRDLPFFFGNPDGNTPNTREYESNGLGSGVIVRKTGKTVYVLTNNHVAGGATKITIKLNDGRSFDGTLVGADDRIDIALVSFETDDNNITVAKMGDSSDVQQGDIVLALGSPLGYFASVTQGIVSATGRSGTNIGSISDFIQTDAAINQGNSGGPLVNIWGEVIGINTWIASQSGGSQGLGFSIPINNIKSSIDQFINNGKISYGWIGVSLSEPTEEYKKELGVEKLSGAMASEVFIDGPAMKGGMQAGDFIIALNGAEIKDVEHLIREIGKVPAGESRTFTVIRGGKKKELTITTSERSEEIVSDSTKLWPGFTASPITDEIRKKLNLSNKVQGIVVTNVQAKSPAAALRLQTGDIITAVNDKKISSVKEFYEALDTSTNSKFWFDIYSEGHTISTATYKIK